MGEFDGLANWRSRAYWRKTHRWTYDEDRSQVRTQQGPQVMATLRNTAIGLLRHLKLPNVSRAVKHLDRHPEQIAALVVLG